MKSSSTKRSPRYISAATRDIYIQITSVKRHSDNAPLVPIAASYDVNVPAGPGSTVGPPAVTCINDPSNAGNFKCTTTLQMTIGDNTFDIQAWSGTNHTGSKLSEQLGAQQIVQGAQNNLTYSLDGNVNTLIVNGSGACQNGPVGTAFGSVGTTPVTFTVQNKDASGNVIVAPGLPTIKIKDNTATYQSTSGTINAASGGTVGFTITQSTQTFVLTPSSSTITNAPIDVEVVPPSGTDGLAFTKQQPTFQFSTGIAPPTHNFLAAVEQTGANSGQVDFFNVTLGGSGGPDSFGAYSPATLAQTNSTNENKPDVNNPLSLGWDATGDLLIGNGGDGGNNHGNLACIPIGAIATGASTSTTITLDVTTPLSLAYDARDGSVALSDNPVGSSDQLSEFLLTGNYTAATGSRNLVAAGFGNNYTVNIPDLTAGTYASALTDGCEADPAHQPAGPCSGSTKTKIAILEPTFAGSTSATETDIGITTSPVQFAIDHPSGLAYDSSNHQLAIANDSIWHTDLSFYSVSPVSQVKVINTTRKNKLVAASPDGHIAVAERSSTGSGYELIQVFDNTAARNPVGGPIPYNSTSNPPACGAYIYGGDGAGVEAMTWLSNTKLLVAVTATTAGAALASNGLHIYDITSLVVPPGYSDETCAAYAAAPKDTGQQHLNKTPFGVAFKF